MNLARHRFGLLMTASLMLIAPAAGLLLASEARADGTTTMSATLPTTRYVTSAVWDGTHAYIFGGNDGDLGGNTGGYLDQILRYDPGTDTITTMSATLPTPRYATSAVWDGTHAYILGGHDGATFSDDIVRYDPATDTVTMMATSLPTARYAMSAVWDGHHAYVFGGSNGPSLNEILRYDPATDAVTTMSMTLPSARYYTSAVWDGTNASIFSGYGSGDQIVRFSATPPVIVPTVTGTQGTHGWYSSDVTVAWSVADEQSAISSSYGCETSTVSIDTAGLTFTCAATSAGGTATKSVTVKRDVTAPTIILSGRSPAATAEGWNNSPVTLDWTCSDGVSGPAEPSVQATLATEGTAQEVEGACDDLAGNRATDLQGGIHIDLTAPTLTAARSPAANANGWNNGPVDVTFACSDALSGVDRVTDPTTLSSEGAAQQASGTCTDLAGNGASASAGDINIDLTPPEVSIALDGTAGLQGWWVSHVEATLACEDELSGPGAVTYSVNGASWAAYTAPVGLTDEGRSTLDASCTDSADNPGSKSQAVRIDTVAPTAAVTSPRIALGAYAVDAVTSDATSGVGVISIREHLLPGYLGLQPMLVCTAHGGGVAGPNVATRCNRLPETPGEYCYSVVVVDVAGNIGTSPTPNPADPASMVGLATYCTVAVSPGPLPLLATNTTWWSASRGSLPEGLVASGKAA